MILEQIVADLSEILRDRILAVFGHAVDRVLLQAPPRLDMGDLATPVALELARVAKQPPRRIAERLIDGMVLPNFVRSVSVEGAGYLNFRFDRSSFTVSLFRNVMAAAPPNRQKVIVEHTNINPNKAAHIGHLRNAVLGDTLKRSLLWLGYHVETQNYIDDTGVQVADVVVALERLRGEGIEQVRARIANEDVPFDYFCWDIYSQMAQYYEDHPEALEWRRQTLHDIERQEGDSAKMGEIIARAIVSCHIRTMVRLGIEYDLLPKESDILKLHFWDRAFEMLKRSDSVIYEREGKHAGCWVVRLSETEKFEGLEEPDKILVRSNGTVTYVGKDIAYQLWKFGLLDRTFFYRLFSRYADGTVLWETTSDERFSSPDAPAFGGASRVFNVIDVRQAYLQKVVTEGLRLLGHPKQAEESIHFSYEMVALTPATARALGMAVRPEDESRAYVEMSGRKGLGVKADDLLDALESKAAEAIREGMAQQEASLITEAEVQPLSVQIAVAALRYFMLKYGRNRVIAFDFNEALAFEGDSGPYLQYSTVRVENIFRKMRERSVGAMLDEDSLDRLTIGKPLADDLWEIIRMSAEMPTAIQRAVDSLELSGITRAAFELAQKFNSFYHKYPILNEKDPDERQRRAVCAEIFRRTMTAVLELMGIPVPERM
jgi:arginyl-tRNA synthetase